MKKTVITVLTAVALCVSSLMAQNDAFIAKINQIKGKVFEKAKTAKDFTPASIGDKLKGDTFLKTDKKSSAIIILNNGSQITIGEQSMVMINDFLVKSQKDKTSIGVCFGKIDLQVKKLTKDEGLDVTTPTAVAGVRGTKFEVEALPDGSSIVSVDEGNVKLDSDAGATDLGKDQNAGLNFYDNKLDKNVKQDDYRKQQADFLKNNPDKVMDKMTGKMSNINGQAEGMSKDLEKTNDKTYNDQASTFQKNKCKMAGMNLLTENIFNGDPTNKVLEMYYKRAKAIDDRFNEISKMIDDKLRKIDEMYNAKSKAIDDRYNSVGKKLDNIDDKFKSLDDKFKSTNQK